MSGKKTGPFRSVGPQGCGDFTFVATGERVYCRRAGLSSGKQLRGRIMRAGSAPGLWQKRWRARIDLKITTKRPISVPQGGPPPVVRWRFACFRNARQAIPGASWNALGLGEAPSPRGSALAQPRADIRGVSVALRCCEKALFGRLGRKGPVAAPRLAATRVEGKSDRHLQ